MALAAARAEFAACTASVNAASPLLELFLRAADHDLTLTEVDLCGDAEYVRWPPQRQAAALQLLAGSPHLLKLSLSGLNLTDAVAPALAAVLEADGALQVLSLERNDLRESGLLQLVDALAANTILRELRLTGQKFALPTSVETSLAEMLERGGASSLVKLGLSLRSEAARRTCDACLFRHMDRQQLPLGCLTGMSRKEQLGKKLQFRQTL